MLEELKMPVAQLKEDIMGVWGNEEAACCLGLCFLSLKKNSVSKWNNLHFYTSFNKVITFLCGHPQRRI